MTYNIFSSTAPAMPSPAKGTDICKLLLSKASKTCFFSVFFVQNGIKAIIVVFFREADFCTKSWVKHRKQGNKAPLFGNKAPLFLNNRP